MLSTSLDICLEILLVSEIQSLRKYIFSPVSLKIHFQKKLHCWFFVVLM